ncbi:hypothetical protein [Burkholderia pseudomultivorans]|uniref:hypothetical protein n=1 Tax=Burkholderia pseudomultivorans TaxID=1207504 RepID=UPI0012DB5159|nr:hypothetical protein [Burkholderia pseudomultivorans]
MNIAKSIHHTLTNEREDDSLIRYQSARAYLTEASANAGESAEGQEKLIGALYTFIRAADRLAETT